MKKISYSTQPNAVQLPLFVSTKVCATCEQEKDLEDFTKVKDGVLGRMAHCKSCRAAKDREKRARKNEPKPTTKICIDCGEEKPINDFLTKNATPRCSICRKAFSKAYQHAHYLAHQEEKLAKTHEYYYTHQEQYHGYWEKRKQDPADRARRNAVARRYNKTERHRAYSREYCRRTRSGNPKWQEYDRQRYWNKGKREKSLQYFKRRSATPEFKEYRRQYRAAHPEQDIAQSQRKRLLYATESQYAARARQYSKAWAKANPHRVNEASRRRHARKRQGVAMQVSYKAILERDGYQCYICEQAIDPTIKKGPASLHFDHVIPLAKHGQHIETNLKPTHACCNMRKNARLLEDMTSWDRRGPEDSPSTMTQDAS